MQKINDNLKLKIRCGFLPALMAASTTTKWGLITAITTGISLVTSLTSSILNISTNASEATYSYDYDNQYNSNNVEIKRPSYISNIIKPTIKIF